MKRFLEALVEELLARAEDSIEEEVELAELFRRPEIPEWLVPRSGDLAHLRISGGAIHAKADVVAFRFGRARFVPPVIFHDVDADLARESVGVVVRVRGHAHDGAITTDITLPPDAPTRAEVRIDTLAAPFVRDVLLTLGRHYEVPADFAVKDVALFLSGDRNGVAWRKSEAGLGGGRVSTTGFVEADGTLGVAATLAGVSLAGIREHELSGLLSGAVALAREPDGDRATEGDFVIDAAKLPIVGRATPHLARYGLAPLPPEAVAPVTFVLEGSRASWRVKDLVVPLAGATIRGNIEVSRGETRTIAARLEVELGDEYLRSSRLLAVPTMLSERVIVPVIVAGSLDAPDVHADVKGTFARWIKENRISALFTSAIEEASLFFRGSRAPAPPPEAASRPTRLRDAILHRVESRFQARQS